MSRQAGYRRDDGQAHLKGILIGWCLACFDVSRGFYD